MFTIILSVLALAHGSCSDYVAAAACGADTTCVWNPGSCSVLGPSDCTVESCAAGCNANPPVEAACTAPTTCGSGGATNTDSCSSLGSCAWSDNSCANLTAPLNCVYTEADDSCTVGCLKRYNPQCDPPTTSSSPSDCDGTSTASLLECGLFCTISGSSCVSPGTHPAYDAVCPTLSATRKLTECVYEGEGFCKVSGSSCILNSAAVPFLGDMEITEAEATAHCATLSLTELSECTSDRDCKIANGACAEKTNDEKCQSNRVIPEYSECEVSSYGCCEPNAAGTQCVSSGHCSGDFTCSGSVAITVSDCVRSGCVIIGGACREDSFTCTLNGFGDDCDAASLAHHCSLGTEITCENIDCPTYSSAECPSVGCQIATVGECSFTESCDVNSDLGCSADSTSKGCVAIPPALGTCQVDSSIAASTCTGISSVTTCQDANGCKWNSGVGGKCETIVVPPPPPPGDDNTGGASAVYRPLFMLLVFAFMFL